MKTSLPEEVIAAWNRGDKIEALKVLRDKTGLGLKEAKYLLESNVFPGAEATPPNEPSAQDRTTAAAGAVNKSLAPGAGKARPTGLAPGEVRASRVSASTVASIVIAVAAAAYFIFRSG